MTPSIIFKSHKELNEYQGSKEDLDYIDYELSVKLDSTDAFEGPEKLLELWFSPNSNKLPKNWPINGLRNIPLNEIENLLKIVNCEILSKISSTSMDAYLLSESSLFIYPNKFILKTCGTTTTLLCFDKLKELIIKYCNKNENFEKFNSIIYKIFYSRRSFMFPEMQKSIHKNWDSELEYLSKYFDQSTSKSYIFGDEKKDNDDDDRWYLYVNGNDKLNKEFNEDLGKDFDEDFSVELIMTELNIDKAKQFELNSYNEEYIKSKIINSNTQDIGHVFGNYMMNQCGLNNIITNKSIKHDSFAFKPCGYSSNSILDLKLDKFYTIHITPENGWSFASFETNFKPKDKIEFNKIISNIIQILKPGKFSLILFNEKKCKVDGQIKDNKFELPLLDEYNIEKFENKKIPYGYDLLYSMYKLKK